jgi:hypothetical protein
MIPYDLVVDGTLIASTPCFRSGNAVQRFQTYWVEKPGNAGSLHRIREEGDLMCGTFMLTISS